MADRTRALQDVLRNSTIWRGRELAHEQSRNPRRAVSTAWPGLDEVLPDAGWPVGVLIELLSEASGAGELSLLLPALRSVCEQGQGIALLAPPWLAHARAWESWGIPLERMLVVNANGGDLLWAAEQTLRSGECGAALLWAEAAGHRLNHRALQRLHLAAGTGKALCFLYRSIDEQEIETKPSPAPLRLRLAARDAVLQVRIIKSRGALRANPIPVQPFPAHWSATAPHTVNETNL